MLSKLPFLKKNKKNRSLNQKNESETNARVEVRFLISFLTVILKILMIFFCFSEKTPKRTEKSY